MNSSPRPRANTTNKVTILLAILLCAGAWARVLHTHLTSPSPARYTEFYTAEGPIDPPTWPHCHGTRIIVGMQVWQHCDQSEAAPAGFVRFNLSAGRADQLWPVDDASWEQVSDRIRLDRSIDGAIVPFDRADLLKALERSSSGVWTPSALRPPIDDQDLLGCHSDLQFTTQGIERLGRCQSLNAEYTQVGGKWLSLVRRDGAVFAVDAAQPGELHGPLASEGWLASGATFIPRDGGYTVLGTFGTYVNLDENLERSDHLSLFARIAAHFRHFRRFAWYNDTWLTSAPLKMATLPIVLFGLPLFLLPGLIRRRRASPGAAALWLILALSFAWHFWYFTGPRWF